MDEKLLKIGEAAALLGVSVPTLRVWTDAGKARAGFVTPGGHRFYRKHDLERMMKPLLTQAQMWASDPKETTVPSEYHCQDVSVFRARWSKFEAELMSLSDLTDSLPLIAASVGEIGNNSFDHNVGNWPDARGIFFAHDMQKRYVVIADRGQGVLSTLVLVKPSLATDAAALQTAFTEVISGRAPEARGNGLKFVRKVVRRFGLPFMFQSGEAVFRYDAGAGDLILETAATPIRGIL